MKIIYKHDEQYYGSLDETIKFCKEKMKHPIRTWRKENGNITQVDFAKLLREKTGKKIYATRITHWETGAWFPREAMLDRIYEPTGINAVDLYVAYRILMKKEVG